MYIFGAIQRHVSEYKMWKLLRRFSEMYVCWTKFRKENSSTKINKNPTNRLVTGTLLKMDRQKDGRAGVVFLIYFIKEDRKKKISSPWIHVISEFHSYLLTLEIM